MTETDRPHDDALQKFDAAVTKILDTAQEVRETKSDMTRRGTLEYPDRRVVTIFNKGKIGQNGSTTRIEAMGYGISESLRHFGNGNEVHVVARGPIKKNAMLPITGYIVTFNDEGFFSTLVPIQKATRSLERIVSPREKPSETPKFAS